MKIKFLPVVAACGDLALDVNNLKEPACFNGTCVLECKDNYITHFQRQKLEAKCSNGTWTHHTFGCCERSPMAYGKAFAKKKRKRNYGKKYAEASENYALLAFQIKTAQAASAGYSFLIQFDALLPTDVEIQTFARFKVVSRHDDLVFNRTLVMLTSTNGSEPLEINKRMDINFGLRSTETNIKEFVEQHNYRVKFYDGPQTHWCPGNAEIDLLLKPQPLLFGSFNIQVFGQTKYGKTVVKDKIVEILKRYDVVTIQEIRDVEETAFPSLVNDMNNGTDSFGWHTGARQGSTSSKEQYGFIWNKQKLALHDAYDYEDVNGWFERPPTVAYFNVFNENNAVQKFAVISAHIKPVTGSTNQDTEDEINHLYNVYQDAIVNEPDYVDAIIAGDMNADCTYVQEPADLELYQNTNVTWLIGFDEDTTVKTTDCAYDHMILLGPNIQSAFESPTVFDYAEYYGTDAIFYDDKAITEQISDHYPVEVTIA